LLAERYFFLHGSYHTPIDIHYKRLLCFRRQACLYVT